MNSTLQCGAYQFPLIGEGARPLIMGILNVTPDSFSDGGKFQFLDAAINRAEQMIAEGADIIDIGGESTRPGAAPVSLEEELRRVIPLVHALKGCGKPISIDTYKPEVMQQGLKAGADMINDIRGFRTPGAIEAIQESQCAVCIMHMQHEPTNMQENPSYTDVLAEVSDFLSARILDMAQKGVARKRMIIDPGFGFGKTLEHNLALLKGLNQIRENVDLPILAGLSRKSMLQRITGRATDDRLAASLAAGMLAVLHGAQILRVHDVAASVDMVRVWQAVQQ